MNGRNGVLYIGKLKGAITMEEREEIKRQIVDMTNQIQDEKSLRFTYWFLKAVLNQAQKEGNQHE